MRKPIKSSLLLLALFSLLLLFWQAPMAHAATEDGQISGQVVNATNKSAPVANQPVTLQMAQGSSTRDVGTVKTDAQGKFSFTKLATDQTINYVVYTNFQKAQYISKAVTLNTQSGQVANVQVYEATTSTDNVAIVQSTLLIRQADPSKGLLNVSQVFSFQNLNNKTYVGSLNASKGKPNALLFSLPAGVKNITLGNGFTGYEVLQVPEGFASDAALLPGSNEFSYSYEVPYSSSSYNFIYQTQYPTVSLSILVDPGLHASSHDVTSSGVVNADNHAYHAFKSSVLPAHSRVSLTIDGLTVPNANDNSPSFNAGLIWLLVGLLVVVALLVMTWFLLRARRKRQASPVKQKKDVQKTVAEKAPEAEAGSEQALLQELLTLDKEYEAGKINKERYEKQRNRTKARLRTLMSEKESARR
ncbi:hypothetical protein KDA_13750 [Dictyobacter alpinus]|uniref:Carboxypeptidase regulatory-like domain-containing protein n=1 Tax=Dictyobacter alpinus TaxID=2014873 RepID=A0A402B3G1_9CHLR|nr:carboxypeptidase-like regulatory domain-containing protein [Dictyobacter alpinus]GCE25891.1 hypothetical protein KDA_13750 [Dictyobacter alpinus]